MGKDELAKQFWAFLKKTLEEFELDKTDKERVEFNMKFGDEYSTYCSVGIGALPERWDVHKYLLNAPIIIIPLNKKEIEFFWECIAKPVLI